MLYQLYQAQADMMLPLRALARAGESMARAWNLSTHATANPLRHFGAVCELIANATVTHQRPSYGIQQVSIGGEHVPVHEEAADDTPFATLLRFRAETDTPRPKVLLVAPMSGHFATLLRGTISVMLPDHDVHITDWKNARDIPERDGVFDLDAFIDHLIRFMRVLGPGAHMLAVCQPAVAALAATAIMAEADDPAQPRSLTLMAGPIDTRINPTRVNRLAQSRPITWFESNLIARVPWRYAGAGRLVYPGFIQLAAFMNMNMDRHLQAHIGQFRAVVSLDEASAQAHRRFYDEYGAVMDLPAAFYLQTVQRVFQDHDLPLGRLTWRDHPIRPEAIRRTALMTVEGERDDICAIGQTVAALDLCGGVPNNRKRHHLQSGVGHYGVFSGSRWAREIYPRVRAMIQRMS